MHKGRDFLILFAVLAVAFFIYAQLNGPDGSEDDSSIDDGSDTSSLDDIFDDFSSSSTDDSSSTGASDVYNVATSWASAIQKLEGYFPGSRSFRNNNPGNIVGTGDAGSDSDGYAKYSSYGAGFDALVSDLQAKLRKYPNYTITQIMARYAPKADGTKLNAGNNPSKYATDVANYLNSIFGGITTNTTLSQLAVLG